MTKNEMTRQLIKMKLFLEIKALLEKNNIGLNYSSGTIYTNDGMEISLVENQNGTIIEVRYELPPTLDRDSNEVKMGVICMKSFKKIFRNITGTELLDNPRTPKKPR